MRLPGTTEATNQAVQLSVMEENLLTQNDELKTIVGSREIRDRMGKNCCCGSIFKGLIF